MAGSWSADNNDHDGSGYWVWTGNKYVGPNSRTIQPTDWPYFGSMVKRFKPSEKLPPLSVVWLPDWAGPAPWKTAHIRYASVKVWQYDDPGDVRGVLTADIGDSFAPDGRPLR